MKKLGVVILPISVIIQLLGDGGSNELVQGSF